MQPLKVIPQQVVVVRENNVRFGLLFTEGLSIVTDREKVVPASTVASLEVEVARTGVALPQLPGAGALPGHGPAQGGQAENVLLHVTPQRSNSSRMSCLDSCAVSSS